MIKEYLFMDKFTVYCLIRPLYQFHFHLWLSLLNLDGVGSLNGEFDRDNHQILDIIMDRNSQNMVIAIIQFIGDKCGIIKSP